MLLSYTGIMEYPTIPGEDILFVLLEASARRHQHLCPRQVLGVRLGLRGLRELGFVNEFGRPFFKNEEKRLLTIVETDGCGADGVAVATDCFVGRRTLRVLDYGKVAATLVDTATERAVRVAPKSGLRERVWSYAPDAPSRWQAYLAAYQIMPDEEMLKVQPVRLRQPPTHILSRPNVRVNCQRCGEEIMNEREVRLESQIYCRPCAGESYYV